MVNNIFQLPSFLKPFSCKHLIRLGKDYDGGYLINELDIKRTNYLLTFGVGDDISFEKDFLKFNPCEVILFDRNINVPILDSFKYYKKNVIHDISLQDIFKNKNKVFLKCDIEGDEYFIIEFLINNAHIFTGLIIEFHDIQNNNKLDNLANFISKFKLPLVHCHINNHFYFKTESINIPSVLELTFSSSDNVFYDKYLKLPNKLDMRNKKDEIDFLIQFYEDI